MSGSIGGHTGFGQSNYSLLPEILTSAKKCVEEFCLLKPGEKVLIVSEPDTDPLISNAFLAACILSKADAVIMNVPAFSAGGWMKNTPSDMLVSAGKEANLIIACTNFELAHSEKTFYHTFFGTKTRVCSLAMAATPGCLLSATRFPMELYFEISKRIGKILRGASRIKFTSRNETILEFSHLKALVNSLPIVEGGWDVFPPIGINFYSNSVDGLLTFDESTITGRPTEPIRMIIKDNFVEEIIGGVEAEVEAIRAYANGKYFVRHAVVGLHPKIRIVNAPQFERARAAGVAYVGLDGTGPTGQINREGPGFSHLDCIIDTPTISVDEEILVRDRKLLILDDNEIIEIAKSYGDPKKILSQNSYF